MAVLLTAFLLACSGGQPADIDLPTPPPPSAAVPSTPVPSTPTPSTPTLPPTPVPDLPQPPETPSVLLIIADDLTQNALSSYGNPVVQTPRIDGLASQGVRFTRAYSQFPICGPSRASMMTGYYPHGTGVFAYTSGREAIGEDGLMWPQVFKEEGYSTTRVSKVFHMGVPWTINVGGNGSDDPASWTAAYNSQAPEWESPGVAEVLQDNPNGTVSIDDTQLLSVLQAEGDDLVQSDGISAQTAVDLLDTMPADEPFFLAVGFVRPHLPFVAPAPYFDPYPHQDMVLPALLEDDWDDIPNQGINYVNHVENQMSLEQEQKALAGYYASVAFLDAQVGKVLDALEASGRADETIVIFTSDHGFHLGEHGFWSKVGLHEESVQIPLIIDVPWLNASGTRDTFVELVDLFPTTVELAGLVPPPGIQGESLVPALTDAAHVVREDAFATTHQGNSTLLRTEEFALMRYGAIGQNGTELYDMVADPEQFHNVADDPGYAAVREALEMRLTDRILAATDSDL